MSLPHLLWLILLGPLLGGGLALLPRSSRTVLAGLSALVLGHAFLCAVLCLAVFAAGPLATAHGWLRLDALSALHLGLLAFVFATSTLFAARYFATAELSLPKTRIFGALWLASLSAMTLVLIANHLGLMWVGVETTTLMTTFLIALHRSRESLEATWKYLMICS
ncbi:MAG TPA: hydrogenase, partial [Polyangia bacterium]